MERTSRPRLLGAMLAVLLIMAAGLLPTLNRAAHAQTAGILDHVLLTPVAATLQPQGQQQFTAQAYDAGNTPIAGLTYAWTAAGTGTITASGLFTAGSVAGTYDNAVQVSVTQGAVTKSAAASIVIASGVLDHVTVTPATATLPRGGSQQFTAQAYDTSNNPIAGLTHVWTAASGGTITASGLFTAGQVPETYANAVQASVTQGSVTKVAMASVTVTPETHKHGKQFPSLVGLVHRTINALLHKKHFTQFQEMQLKALNEQGEVVTFITVAGTVTATSDNSITIMPNGATASQTYTVADETRFIPNRRGALENLQAGDKVVVVTQDGTLKLVVLAPWARKQAGHQSDDEDRFQNARERMQERMERLQDRFESKRQHLGEQFQWQMHRMDNDDADED